MLEESAKQWKYKHQAAGRARAIGRAEGRAEGEVLGARNALASFLQFRFGPLPVALTRSLRDITDTAILYRLVPEAYAAASLEAFLRRLPQPNQN